MTDNCEADFSELDRDQLLELCNSMHDQIHAYDDAETRVLHWIANMGYTLDNFAQEIAQANVYGSRKQAMAEAAGEATNLASICYHAVGITRDEVSQAVEFSNIVSPLVDDPDFNKD